jgi:hypothetical protein
VTEAESDVEDVGWVRRWREAAVAAQAARATAAAAPHDDALEIARWEAFGRLDKVEEDMVGELLIMLRRAVRLRPDPLRALIRELLADELNELHQDIQDVAQAVAWMERERKATKA